MKIFLQSLFTATLIALSITPFNTVLAEETLRVFSALGERNLRPVMAEFSRQTGIQIEIQSGDATTLLNTLKQGDPKTSPDLFLSHDAISLQRGSQLGLFRPLPPALIAPIDARFRAPDNTWLGLSRYDRVLVVNSEGEFFADKPLQSIFDLGSPALKGKLAISSSRNDSFIAGVTTYLQLTDREKTAQWLRNLKENISNEIFPNDGEVVAAVASGSKQVGLVSHYDIYRYYDKHPSAPIRIVVPDQGDGFGIAWNISGIAIPRNTHNPKLAEQLVDFLVSDFGQQLFADTNREYPFRKDVYINPQIPRGTEVHIADVPLAGQAAQWNDALDLITRIGLP